MSIGSAFYLVDSLATRRLKKSKGWNFTSNLTARVMHGHAVFLYMGTLDVLVVETSFEMPPNKEGWPWDVP